MTIEPFYKDDFSTIFNGDCREVLGAMKANVFDSVCTDPPYELGFMYSKKHQWDKTGIAYDVKMWEQVLRTMKPGAYLAAFGGSRTYHRMACAIEDAGFEIRDSLMWLYGMGFPKSSDMSKAIDKTLGKTHEREVISSYHSAIFTNVGNGWEGEITKSKAATPEAAAWEGWGTGLKPAFEPIVLARKPLDGTAAKNALKWGTGGINIDGCRVGENGGTTSIVIGEEMEDRTAYGPEKRRMPVFDMPYGRWPANVLLGCYCETDVHEDECAVAILDKEVPDAGGGFGKRGHNDAAGVTTSFGFAAHGETVGFGDFGGASRFFYTAKASRSERESRLDLNGDVVVSKANPRKGEPQIAGRRNTHTTVKPVAVMRWLVKLITPPGGRVCDPFMGSGGTRLAAFGEGARFVGIDLSAEYCDIASRRG